MLAISHFFERILNSFQDFNPIPFLKRIPSHFLKIISPNQSVRPDSFFSCCVVVIPHIKKILALQIWKVHYLFQKILHRKTDLEKGVQALQILSRIEEAYEKNTKIQFNNEERRALSEFFAKLTTQSTYIEDLLRYLTFAKNEDLLKKINPFQDICKVIYENQASITLNKIEKITEFLQNSEGEFPNAFKIGPKDYRMLFFASSRKKLLQALVEAGIKFQGLESLVLTWHNLEQANKGPTLQKIRQLSSQDCVSGRIFFGSRPTLYEIRNLTFDLSQSFMHLLTGRLLHMGILVKKNDKTHISHVNQDSNSHGVKPITDPLFFSFFNLLDLDIEALLPSEIAMEHKLILKQFFSNTFERLASEEHRDISLINHKSYLATLLWGPHKKLSSTRLSEVKLIPHKPQICSSYVGIIFLRAVHELNLKIISLGYKCQISHPFGSHEIVENVDILRLLYHWTRLRVIRSVPIHPLLTKVLSVSAPIFNQ